MLGTWDIADGQRKVRRTVTLNYKKKYDDKSIKK